MISLSGAVNVVLLIMAGAFVFGLLTWLVDYCEIKDPWRKAARFAIAILSVLVLIGIILSVVGGGPVFRP